MLNLAYNMFAIFQYLKINLCIRTNERTNCAAVGSLTAIYKINLTITSQTSETLMRYAKELHF